MWYNLIFIELNFNINSIINFFNNFLDFFFHDEFLWERKNHNSNYIKEFAIELIKSKVIKNGFEYEKGVESLTKDCLDCKNNLILNFLLYSICKLCYKENFRRDLFL